MLSLTELHQVFVYLTVTLWTNGTIMELKPGSCPSHRKFNYTPTSLTESLEIL